MKREERNYFGEYRELTDTPGTEEKMSGEEAFEMMYGNEKDEYSQDEKDEFLELYYLIASLGY